MTAAADDAWKRLNARGDARIYQGRDADGRCRPVVLWWPRGQLGNPFCQRNFPGATLEEALVLAESATRPPELSVDEVAMRRGIERRMDNRRLAEVSADGKFSP
jgi:hypothetical protein